MELGPLRQKKALLSRICDLTEAAVFTDGEDDAPAFIELMENRERLFAQIKILDEKISGIEPGTEAEGIMSDIIKTTGDIIALDKKNEAAASRIMTGLKKSLKGINEGKSVNAKYNEFIASNDGMYFDKKN